MSRYDDAQVEMLDALIAVISEQRGFTYKQSSALSNGVWSSDEYDPYSGELWQPLVDFVNEVADDVEDGMTF
jgi:hypothetical protein